MTRRQARSCCQSAWGIRCLGLSAVLVAFSTNANADAGQLPSANRTAAGPPATLTQPAPGASAPAPVARSTQLAARARAVTIGQLPSANRSGGGGPVTSVVR